MPLELHVWGPGFGLPSIDAECLGAIAYLRHCLPEGEWKVVASSHSRLLPLGEFPILQDVGTLVFGFTNIVKYLRQVSNGDWDLDGSLNRNQQADCIAFTSFIESRGQPLLDLSLYVSSDNYNGSTKVALSHVLTWPGSWTVPGKLRDKAKKRSEHLGLASLDVDAALEDVQRKNDTGLTAQIPERLRMPKQTVSALLGKSIGRDKFRLDAVTADFMEPVEDLLAHNVYLLGERVTSLDCLAIGYLSLMQRPDLAHGWLKVSLQKNHARLGEWSHGFTKESYDKPLSWLESGPAPIISSERIGTIMETLVGALPLLSRNYGLIELPQHQSSRGESVYATKMGAMMKVRTKQHWFDRTVFSTIVFGAFTGYMLWTGLLVWPQRATKPSRRDFGAAGAMLGLGLR